MIELMEAVMTGRSGWFIRTPRGIKNTKYLRKDGRVLAGTGYGLSNDCYYETEQMANNARRAYLDKYKGNRVDKIQIIVNGEAIDLKNNPNAACLAPKTDLEKKLPFAMVVYDVNGAYEKILYNKTKKGLKKRKNKFLKHPLNIGKTVTLHECYGVFTNEVPIVEVK